MTIKQLLTIADKAYPDHQIAQCFDLWSEDCEERPNNYAGTGDTLALFIGRELKSTFEPVTDDHTEEDQLDEASRVMQAASSDCRKLADEFDTRSFRLFKQRTEME